MTQTSTDQTTICFHCGQNCPDRTISDQGRFFCCTGCLSVYHLLSDARLDGYYSDQQAPGVRPGPEISARHAYLDDPVTLSKLLDYQDRGVSRVTFHLPQMHCASCVWLLERLYRFHDGIQRSEVNFPERKLTVLFRHETISLRRVVELLAQLGYEPDIKLASLERKHSRNPNVRLYARIGVAGFSFANIMLFSLPEYFSGGLTDSSLSLTFRIASLILATPVLLYSASDYFRSAFHGLRDRFIGIDLPISLGIGMLYFRSLYDIVSNSGPGYLDSFTGLVFFLLAGRLFQQKTFERLSFERDYRSYFPISAVRLEDEREGTVPITELRPGDRIMVRNQELVPADAILVTGQAQIDYSFVTGESEPQTIAVQQKIYAGGRQIGGAIQLEVVRPVSQSYLVSLWSSQQLPKDDARPSMVLANSVGGWFTAGVLMIAVAGFAYWMVHDPRLASTVFTSVLIVACPCALALSAPFVLGTASRLWGKQKLFVRNSAVIESMFDLDSIVFDKTGTLTYAERRNVEFHGTPLTHEEQLLVGTLARQSTHPISRALAGVFTHVAPVPISGFTELPGLGLEGGVGGRTVRIGSHSWVTGLPRRDDPSEVGWTVSVAIDGRLRGEFHITNLIREGLDDTVRQLETDYSLFVLSGDSPREEARLRELFGAPAHLSFGRSPHDKLNEVAAMQTSGRRVLMIGDGLNDAGALRVAAVGMAVTEDTSAFTPACDAILDTDSLTKLSRFLRMARSCRRLILVSFGLSLGYNVIGLGFAVTGHLSPLVSAILMPISSVSVVLFAVAGTRFLARKEGLA